MVQRLIRIRKNPKFVVHPRKDKRLIVRPRLAGSLVMWVPQSGHLVTYEKGRYIPSAEHLMDEMFALEVPALGLLWLPDDHDGRLASAWVRRNEMCFWRLWIIDVALPDTPAIRRMQLLAEMAPKAVQIRPAPWVEVSARQAMIDVLLSWKFRRPQWPVTGLWGFWAHKTIDKGVWCSYHTTGLVRPLQEVDCDG